MLMRHPTTTVIALVTLALGIGASTAVFSVIDATLLTPLPFEQPDRLVRLYTAKPASGWSRMTVSALDFRDWTEQSSSFDASGLYTFEAVNVMGKDNPDRLRVVRATSGVLQTLRIQPTIGRAYDASSDTSEDQAVVLLSDATWRARFGADPDVVGTVIRIDHVGHEVLGVLPPEVEIAVGQFDIWKPFTFGPQSEIRGNHIYNAMARLRDGVTPAEADREVKVIGDRLAETFPESNRGYTATVVALSEVLLGRTTRSVLFALCAAVGFVLLIACVNIANLLLSTAAGREREFAVRTALGAGPGRLVRQMLTESALLAVGGGLLGVAVAFWGVDILAAGMRASVGPVGEVAVNGRTLGFTLLLLGATSVGFGLPAAVRAFRTQVSDDGRANTRSVFGSRRERVRRDLLVVVQVALALALMISAGLMIRSLMSLKAVDPGFDTANLLTMRVSLPGEQYPSDAEQLAFFDDTISRIRALPGVRSASATSVIPLLGDNSNSSMSIEDHPVSDPADITFVGSSAVIPGYLETMDIPVLQGRDFTELDGPDSPPAIIINRMMANHFWPNESAIGKRVKFGQLENSLPWMEVVGVMGDHRQTSLNTEPRFETLYVQGLFTWSAMTFAIRTEGDAGSMIDEVENVIWSVEPEIAVFQVDTMDEIVARNTRSIDDLSNLLTGFSVLALVLALGGLYGVMSFTVGRRTQEIGLRMALGAEARSILVAILSKSAILVLSGVIVGGLIAWLLSRWLQGMLFEVSALDPVTYAAVAAAMLGVGLLAGLIPALKAARINPVTALHDD
jgi:putative ABC transport system permease protein